MSEKHGIFSDKIREPNSMQSIEGKVIKRIRGKGRGAVFLPKDFFDLGSRSSVDQALSRLVRKGHIRRLSRGLYDYPKVHPRLGELTPPPDVIARALARRTEAGIQTSGARAVNTLGLSTQVPARAVYLTLGNSRRVKVGKQTIDLRHRSPKNIMSSSEVSGMVIQALHHLGQDGVDEQVIKKLRNTLSDADKEDLKKDIKTAPEWMRQVIVEITG
ncbi:MAG: type IV toxin-antitoxin system AbiEi family antitoxin domain-containing protein [Acidobacteria bacterium]|nr:type IV toxin-antitoxin system AbiEi family antitoxin domain-containing protein [Acidobacteriota bacterium]